MKRNTYTLSVDNRDHSYNSLEEALHDAKEALRNGNLSVRISVEEELTEAEYHLRERLNMAEAWLNDLTRKVAIIEQLTHERNYYAHQYESMQNAMWEQNKLNEKLNNV